MSKHGTLVIIGGREDREGDMLILREVASRVHGGRIVVTTVASREPEGMFEMYRDIFRDFGVEAARLHVDMRSEAFAPGTLDAMKDAQAIFFTGGDQMRITSQIGGTPVHDRIREIHASGGVIAGTSAGASVMCETMLVGGAAVSHRSDLELPMAPGFGLLKDCIVDQHFAERGRYGRLLGAVARNPRNYGIGIDEDTAIVVEGNRCFRVIGSGAVYVLDGYHLTYSNIADSENYRTLSVFNLKTHVLSMGDSFDLVTRTPASGSHRDAEREILRKVPSRKRDERERSTEKEAA